MMGHVVTYTNVKNEDISHIKPPFQECSKPNYCPLKYQSAEPTINRYIPKKQSNKDKQRANRSFEPDLSGELM